MNIRAAVVVVATLLSAPLSGDPVVWTNMVGVAVTGTGLKKTAAQGWGNGGAVSTQSLPSNGYIEVTVGETNTERMVGLSNGDTDQQAADIDFALDFQRTGGLVAVRENGAWQAALGYATGDSLRVSVQAGVVTYAKNGTVFYTSKVVPLFPLLVDTAFYDPDATLNNVVISGNGESFATWVKLEGVVVVGNGLKKTNAQGWGTAGAVSTQSLSGNGYVEVTVGETNTDRMVGLSNSDTDKSYQDIDFALHISSGLLAVREQGVWKGALAYATGDKLRVAVQAGVVTYAKNGTVFFTSAVVPVFPLLVDTAFYDVNATLTNVVIAGDVRPGELPVAWTNPAGVLVSGNSLKQTAASGCTSPGNAGASSTGAIALGSSGYVEMTAGETNTERLLGLSNDDTDKGYQDIDYALDLQSTGGLVAVRENGVWKAALAYATGDKLRVSVQERVVTYSKNGTVFYTSATLAGLNMPLLVDTSLCDLNATLNNVVISGTILLEPGIRKWRLAPRADSNDTLTFTSVAAATQDDDVIELTSGTFKGRLRLRNYDGVTLRGAGNNCPAGVSANPVAPKDCTIITSESRTSPCPASLTSKVCASDSYGPDAAHPNPACIAMSKGQYKGAPVADDFQTLLLERMTKTTVESLSVQNLFYVGYYGSAEGQGCTTSIAVRVLSGPEKGDYWDLVFNRVDIRSSGKDTLTAARSLADLATANAFLTVNNSTIWGGYFIFDALYDDSCQYGGLSTATFNSTIFHAAMPEDANHSMISLDKTDANFNSCAFWDDNASVAAARGGTFLFDGPPDNLDFSGQTQKAIFSAHACTDVNAITPLVEITIDSPTGNLGGASGWLNVYPPGVRLGAHVTVTGPRPPLSGVDPAPFFPNNPLYNGNAVNLAQLADVQHQYVTRFPPDVTVHLSTCSSARGSTSTSVYGNATDSSTSGELYVDATGRPFPFAAMSGNPEPEPNASKQMWRPEAFFAPGPVPTLTGPFSRKAPQITSSDAGAGVGCGVLERTFQVIEHRARANGPPTPQPYSHVQRIVFTSP